MRLYIILILLLILPIAIAVDTAITTTDTSFDPISSYDWLYNNTNINSIPAQDAAFAFTCT